MDDTQEQPQQPSSLEERFTALRQSAEAIGSTVDLGVVVGGVRLDEIYRVYENTEPDATLEERIALVERMLKDDRFVAAAEATKRMVEAEGIGREFARVIENRRTEYDIAARALRQAYEIDARPEDGDEIQATFGLAAMLLDHSSPGEILAKILAEATKDKQPEQPEQPEQPS